MAHIGPELLTILRDYTRITPQQACEETRGLLLEPNLNVWVYLNGAWALMHHRLISQLWSANDPDRSICHLLFRDVLHLDEDQYTRLKAQLNSSELSGMYRGPNDTYAIVINLEEVGADAKTTAIASGLGAHTAGILTHGGFYTPNPEMVSPILPGGLAVNSNLSYTPFDPYEDVSPVRHPVLNPDSYAPYNPDDPEGPPASRPNFQDVVLHTYQPSNPSPKRPSPSVPNFGESEGLPRYTYGYTYDDTYGSHYPYPEAPLNQNLPKGYFSTLDDKEFSIFRDTDYAIDACLQKGNMPATSSIVLAFYYFGILPDHQRRDVYLNVEPLGRITYELLDRTDPMFHIQRQHFQTSLNKFISAVPANVKLGITLMKLPNHSTLLVFDVVNQRLEFYDPNGRGAVYGQVPDDNRTVYQYFVRNLRKLSKLHPRVCKVWGSDNKFQGQDSSCALWTTVIAICRMSGIERSQLPTDIEVVKNISQSIRLALWNTCQFSLFKNNVYNAATVEQSLRACVVAPEEIAHIRTLVMDNLQNKPIPVAADVSICEAQDDKKIDEEKIDCTDVAIDTYKNPLNVEDLRSRCPVAGTITFAGSPPDFPQEWFSITNRIILQPRSLYISLNADLHSIAEAMKKRPNLHVEATLGVVDLSKMSILDHSQSILPRLTITRVLIVGTLPPDPEYTRKVKLLRMFTTPHMFLPWGNDESSNPEWGRRTSPLLHFFVLERRSYSNLAPWSDFLKPFIRRGNVFFSLSELESQPNTKPLEFNMPLACDDMTFDSPLSDEDVLYLMRRCKEKVDTITFRDVEANHISTSVPLLTDHIKLTGADLDTVSDFLVNLMAAYPHLKVHIERCRVTMLDLAQLAHTTQGRLTIDRLLWTSVPLDRYSFNTSLALAQTVYVLVTNRRDIEHALRIGAQYFVAQVDAHEWLNVYNILAEPIAQNRVMFSLAEFSEAPMQ